MQFAPRGWGQRWGIGHDEAGFEQEQQEAIDRRTGDAVSTSRGRRAGEGEQLAASPKQGMRARRAGIIGESPKRPNEPFLQQQ